MILPLNAAALAIASSNPSKPYVAATGAVIDPDATIGTRWSYTVALMSSFAVLRQWPSQNLRTDTSPKSPLIAEPTKGCPLIALQTTSTPFGARQFIRFKVDEPPTT